MGKPILTYEGQAMDVTWDRRLCIHVAECGQAAGEHFVKGRDPWCAPDTSDANALADVVRRCPSGALAYRNKAGADEVPDAVNTITVSSSGPLYARGELQIADAPEDMPGVRFRAALCRCGQSKNKPFCDSSHDQAGFTDRGPIGRTGEALQSEGGPLEITPMANGSLKVTGNFSLVTGTGQKRWTGTRAFLCRCGQSKTKPFCDSSHKAVGFTAPGR